MTRTVPALLFAFTLMGAPVPAIPDPVNEKLFEAVRSVDKDEVRRLLDAGADPNARNEDGVTVLHRAAGWFGLTVGADYAAVVEFLLDAGASVNAQLPLGDLDGLDGLIFDAGDTPLHVAAGRGSADICRLLLERGANVHARNGEAATVLHNAASEPEKMGLMLDAGADIDARDAEGNTALHLAPGRYSSSRESIQLLLDAGADIDARNAEGSTPLHLAAAQGDYLSVELLLHAGADVDARNAEGSAPLHLAAAEISAGVDESVQLLLDRGADLDVRNAEGDTALHGVLWPVGRESVQLLLNAGADLDARNSRGNTPLLEIALFRWWSESMSETVQLMLDAGADISARNADGMNSLEIALTFGREDLLKLLLGVDADIEAWNASEALMERFRLYNGCSPMDYGVSLDLSVGESVQGLTEKAISDAVESRLRAARLYDSEEPSYFFVYIHLLDSMVGGRHAGWAYSMNVSFNKRVADEASGIHSWASTWERGSTGTASDSGTGEAILGSVRGYMDEFLAEYLRVNEKACKWSTAGPQDAQ